MSKARIQQAYQRGVWVACFWTRLKSRILRWDRHCVSKVRSHKLPSWIGHLPMVMLAITLIAVLVFGGAIIGTSAILVGGIILLAYPSQSQHSSCRQTSDSDELVYYDWDHDRFNCREYNPHKYNGWKDD